MEQIWYKEPMSLINEKNYNMFFPNKSQTFVQQLNTIFRFSIYFSIIIFILKRDSNIFFIIIFTGLLTYFLYNADTNNKLNERLYIENKGQFLDKNTNEVCTRPSKNNPYMNVLQSDYKYNSDKPRACNVSRNDVKKEVNKYFDTNLYRDTSDIFHKEASDRQWVTNPSTTVTPDENGKFQDWLYGSVNKTCKGQAWNDNDPTMCYNNQYRQVGQ